MEREVGASVNPPAKNKKGGWRTLLLAYYALGVVYGGPLVSTLDVYPSMPLKSPTEDDYLGIFSIIFWTLVVTGVIKYPSIASKQITVGTGGGMFALYSLLRRNMNTPKNEASNSSILPVFFKDKSRLGKFFETSIVARRILLSIAMFALLESLSLTVLIVLFLLQKLGTSHVSFLFSPTMGAWTIGNTFAGIYSIIHHYPGIFKALSPYYMFHFFLRNGKEGWILLGKIVLCMTGSEALFTDLDHFNRSSSQLSFLFMIYPSLVLTYAGQTAYLIRHPNDHADVLYKFIPTAMNWPMFILAKLAMMVANQLSIMATFSVIKQSVVLDYFPRVKLVPISNKEGEVYSPEINYILMILCLAVTKCFGDGKDSQNASGSLVMLISTIFLTLVMIMIWRTPGLPVALYFLVFFIMEGAYASAVFTNIFAGGWITLAISSILAFIMFAWSYGRQRKMKYELTHKIDKERLEILLSEPGVQRVPGLCFFYTDIQDGLTPILGHYIKNMRSLHKVTIFTTLQCLLVPKVAPENRIVVKELGLKGVYECVIQNGYADSLNHEGHELLNQVFDCRQKLLQKDQGDLPSIQEEISDLEEAKRVGEFHIRGKRRFCIGKNSSWFDRVMLGFYEVMHGICRSALSALGVPLQEHVEVGMLYES